MRRSLLLPALLAALPLLASPAVADCYADYKAKRDNPLRLHYGVVEVTGGTCTKKAAHKQIEGSLSADGWTLLNVLDVFDASGLAERKTSAGKFYLRY